MFCTNGLPLTFLRPLRAINAMTMVNSSKPILAAGKTGCPSTATPSPIGGADIVVQSLVNHGVDTIFAYPGGASIPLHQPLPASATSSA